jgi:outer membrane protein assembly factor BamB
VAAAVLLLLAWVVIPAVVPEAGAIGVIGGVVGGLLVVLWWILLSRAPWSERLGAIVLMVGGVLATSRIVHESIADGMMGMMLPVFAIPVLSLALVASVAASRRLSSGPRRASMAAAILLACGAMALLRTGGVTGDADSDLHWRWTETPEQRLLAQAGDEPAAPRPAPAAAETPAPASPPAAAATPDKGVPAPAGDEPTPRPAEPAGAKTDADWPGFRGPARDGIVHGVRIETDWSRKAPVTLWRRPIGPGWSSFAVQGDLLYTQEQRGEDEVVSCYSLHAGEPVWKHRDAARFWESNAGAGPRATPTLGHGRVYTLGATGILNALDARGGSVVWSRNAVSDTGATVPHWGIAGSPLVIGDIVIAAAAGSLAAYDAATGDRRWLGPTSGGGYSSPHLATIDGVAQVVLLNGAGASSVAPSDGSLLWKHAWPGDGIVQPAVIAGGDLLIGSGSGLADHNGVLRFTVAHEPEGWKVAERWTSAGLKPYFNDFVVHEGHAYGFDGSLLACIDLEDGKRTWKGGRYGHGQLVLLPDQDLLLVLSEQGELALVAAASDRFTELARLPALEGKTWNHPVVVGDVLLARNGQEMAAFRLSLASR